MVNAAGWNCFYVGVVIDEEVGEFAAANSHAECTFRWFSTLSAGHWSINSFVSFGVSIFAEEGLHLRDQGSAAERLDQEWDLVWQFGIRRTCDHQRLEVRANLLSACDQSRTGQSWHR